MKNVTIILWLATMLLRAADTNAPASTNSSNVHPLLGPAGSIHGIVRGPDKRNLVIRYEFLGRTNEQHLTLTNDIADFHFCSWVRDRGVAVALSDTTGEIYWAACYLAHLNKPIYPRKIRSPGGFKLMGIANTRGDTIVVTAIDHRDESVPRGWMYINGCPPASELFTRIPTNSPIQMGGFDHLVEFEAPRRKIETKK